jgi:hypothetical protein
LHDYLHVAMRHPWVRGSPPLPALRNPLVYYSSSGPGVTLLLRNPWVHYLASGPGVTLLLRNPWVHYLASGPGVSLLLRNPWVHYLASGPGVSVYYSSVSLNPWVHYSSRGAGVILKMKSLMFQLGARPSHVISGVTWPHIFIRTVRVPLPNLGALP